MSVEPLPAHRIALRAALAGAAGGLAGGVVTLPLVLLSGEREQNVLMFLATGGGAAVTACFVVAIELARRLPARLHLAALAAMGAVAPAVVICSLIWIYVLAEGKGPERAWEVIMRWISQVMLRLDVSLPGAVAVLLPFSLVGAAHTGGVPGALGRVLPLPTRVGLAAIAGGVAWVIGWFAYPPSGGERVLFASFALLPPALEVATAVAVRVEARLLAWWTKRQEA